jgi:hypothetical protein
MGDRVSENLKNRVCELLKRYENYLAGVKEFNTFSAATAYRVEIEQVIQDLKYLLENDNVDMGD